LALVQQLRFEHPPARIQHGFGHPGLDEFLAAHVANDNSLIAIHDLPRKLMQGVFAPTRRPPVQTLGLLPMTPPLCLRNGLLDVPIEMARFQLVSVARGDNVFQAQVQPQPPPAARPSASPGSRSASKATSPRRHPGRNRRTSI
jgi:hypothetical protein